MPVVSPTVAIAEAVSNMHGSIGSFSIVAIAMLPATNRETYKNAIVAASFTVLLPILLPKHRTSFRFLTAATAAQNSTASVVSFIPPAVEPDAPPISISAIVVISEASLIAE